MKVIATKRFMSPVYGNVEGGQRLDVDERTGRAWLHHKLAIAVEPESAATEDPEMETAARPATRKRGTKAAS